MLRILTERKNLTGIEVYLQSMKIDYTIHKTEGSWHSHPERSLVIETFSVDFNQLKKAAEYIGVLNGQQAVAIQYIHDNLYVYNVAEDKWSSNESVLTNMQGEPMS